MLLLALLACASDPPADSEEGLVEADADTDSDADSDADSDTDTDTDSDSDPPSLRDIEDHSVNRATVTFDEGLLQLATEGGDNPVGGFNGEGVGNKAIAGVPGFDGLALSDLGRLNAVGRSDAGVGLLYLNVLLDLNCDGTDVRILVVDNFGEPEEDTGAESEWRAYKANPQARQWRAVGGLDELLPSHLEDQRGKLDGVIEAYPSACLRDADTGDGGMPTGVETRSVLWILGDSSNAIVQEWSIRKLSVGEVVFEAP